MFGLAPGNHPEKNAPAFQAIMIDAGAIPASDACR